MKVKKWLIGTLSLFGLFIAGGSINVNAARLPNAYCHKWVGNAHGEHVEYNIHHHSLTAIFGHNHHDKGYLYNFKYDGNGYYMSYGMKDTFQPEPMKLINKNKLRAGDSGFTHFYLHRLTKIQIRKAKRAHQRAIRRAKLAHRRAVKRARARQRANRIKRQRQAKINAHNKQINNVKNDLNNAKTNVAVRKSNYDYDQYLIKEGPDSQSWEDFKTDTEGGGSNYEDDMTDSEEDTGITPVTAAQIDLKHYNESQNKVKSLKNKLNILQHQKINY